MFTPIVKKKLIISFSGGRTSAYMLWWILNKWEDRHLWEIVVVFANTGKEVEGTLFFVDECAAEWDIPIVWVEAMHKDPVTGKSFSKKGWSVKAKIVTYENASRKGEPYEEMISVLGIPSSSAPFCSPQLKREAIKSYAKHQLGWKDYYVAIGIRKDEPKRLKKSKKQKVIYFLNEINPTVKSEIFSFFDSNIFDLDIHGDDGNCDNCWKKGILVLVRNIVRNPESFEWWQSMTDKYGYFDPRKLNIAQSFNFYMGGISPK